MARMVKTPGVIFALLLGTATGAMAAPHDIRLDLKVEVMSAIHVPTGCVSSVEYDDGTFVQAFITDPLCLPRGVARRTIPSSERDFYPLRPEQAALIGQ